MAINFNTDIVTALYAGDVASDAAYQAPGTYGLPAGFGATDAEQRILSFVEIMRSYLSQIESVQEAKLLQEVMGRIMAEMHMGTSWNATTAAALAQKMAIEFIAKHNVPSSI